MSTAAIYGKLSAHAGLAALVAGRIHHAELPRKNAAYPAITFGVDVEPIDAHDDDLHGQLRTLYVDVAVYSRTTQESAYAIAEQVKAAFLTVAGTINGLVYTGARFEGSDSTQWLGDPETWVLDLRFSVMESPA